MSLSENGSLYGAIVAAILAVVGWISAAARLKAKSDESDEKLVKLEACIASLREDVAADILAHKREVKADFRAYQELFCQKMAELKAMMQRAEDRRDNARRELTQFREQIASEMGRIRQYMEDGRKNDGR